MIFVVGCGVDVFAIFDVEVGGDEGEASRFGAVDAAP
jgi:hypothetical protein